MYRVLNFLRGRNMAEQQKEGVAEKEKRKERERERERVTRGWKDEKLERKR